MNLLPKGTFKVSTTGKKWVDPDEKTAASAKYAMLKDGTLKRRRRDCTHKSDWQTVTEAHIRTHGGK